LIVQEVLSEDEILEVATTNQRINGAIQQFATKIKNGKISPEDVQKILQTASQLDVENPNEEDVKNSIPNANLFMQLTPEQRKSFIEKMKKRFSSVSTQDPKAVDNLKKDLENEEDPEKQKNMLVKAVDAGIITKDQAEDTAKKIDDQEKTEEDDEVDVEAVKKKYNLLFNLAEEAWGDTPAYQQNKELYVKVLAYVLYYLDNNSKGLQEFIEDAISGTNISKKEFRKAIIYSKKTGIDEPQKVLTILFGNEKWKKAFKDVMNGKIDATEISPSTDTAATGELPQDQKKLAGDTAGDPADDTEATALVRQERQEVAAAVEQATNEENISDDFDKSDAEVPQLQFDQYMKSLDKFFGMGESNKPSFMKVFFLYQQVAYLQGDLLPTLNDIIKPPSFDKDQAGDQDLAFSDVDRGDVATDAPQDTVSEQTRVYTDKSGKMFTKKGQAADDYDMGRRAGKKVKAGMDRLSQLFSSDGEQKKDVEVTKKAKVSLKRELAAQADVLAQCKKIVTSYKKYGTASSLDPEFDGSSLEKQLKKILNVIQTHNARLVRIMAEMIENYEAEARGQVQEANGDVDKKAKIDKIREVYNSMGQNYKRSLRTSLENKEYKKAKKSAEEILSLAKEIVPFFPKMIVHSQSNKVISLSDAINALDGQIKSYKGILRDIFETVRDDAVAPEHVSQMCIQIEQMCSMISDNFDVRCPIDENDKKLIKEKTPQPQASLTDEEAVEDTPETDSPESAPTEPEGDPSGPEGGPDSPEGQPDSPEALPTSSGDQKALPGSEEEPPKQLAQEPDDPKDPPGDDGASAPEAAKNHPRWNKLTPEKKRAVANFFKRLDTKLDLQEDRSKDSETFDKAQYKAFSSLVAAIKKRYGQQASRDVQGALRKLENESPEDYKELSEVALADPDYIMHLLNPIGEKHLLKRAQKILKQTKAITKQLQRLKNPDAAWRRVGQLSNSIEKLQKAPIKGKSKGGGVEYTYGDDYVVIVWDRNGRPETYVEDLTKLKELGVLSGFFEIDPDKALSQVGIMTQEKQLNNSSRWSDALTLKQILDNYSDPKKFAEWLKDPLSKKVSGSSRSGNKNKKASGKGLKRLYSMIDEGLPGQNAADFVTIFQAYSQNPKLANNKKTIFSGPDKLAKPPVFYKKDGIDSLLMSKGKDKIIEYMSTKAVEYVQKNQNLEENIIKKLIPIIERLYRGSDG
jgi:hypothetical protein